MDREPSDSSSAPRPVDVPTKPKAAGRGLVDGGLGPMSSIKLKAIIMEHPNKGTGHFALC